MFDDLASAMFAALQNAKYFKPVFLSQQLQNLRGLREFFLAVVVLQTFRFHIYQSILIFYILPAALSISAK